MDNSLDDEVRVTVIATGLDKEIVDESENISNDTNRYYNMPDHDYNNPQTSINIINNNQTSDSEKNNEDLKEKNIENLSSEPIKDESIPVFGDDLDIPAYLRNKTID